MPLLEREIAESEILEPEKDAIACVLTEGASRPLLSEKDPITLRGATQQIVKLAEHKKIAGKKPQVTGREVTEIIRNIKSKELPACDNARILPEDRDGQAVGGVENPKQQPEPEEKQECLSDEPIEKFRENSGKPKEHKDLPPENGESANHLSLRSALENIVCPCCGAAGARNLVWKCCGRTLDESLDIADEADPSEEAI